MSPAEAVSVAALAPASLSATVPETAGPPLVPVAARAATVAPRPVRRLPTVKIGDLVYLSGGRTILRWRALGPNYAYRVYVAKDARLKDARPVTSFAISQNEYIHTKNLDVNWLAVRVVDPSGHSGRFSEPTYVGVN
jgi:hypothetical protein